MENIFRTLEFYRDSVMTRCDCGKLLVLFQNGFQHKYDGNCDGCNERYAVRFEKGRGWILYNVVPEAEQVFAAEN